MDCVMAHKYRIMLLGQHRADGHGQTFAMSDTTVLFFLSVLCSIDIWNATRHITDNIAFFLPKNANIDQVVPACCFYASSS